MGFVDKLKFHAWDAVGVVIKYIKKWRPRRCTKEKDFENSLYKYLHKKLPDIQVTKQYSQGLIRADLLVGAEVLVELKYNLNTTAKYHRLLGQLAEYRNWDGRIVLLLLGETEPNLLKQLNHYLDREGLLFRSKVTVFQK